MKENARKYLICSMTLLLVFLTACGYSGEEKQEMKQFEKQGEKNAKEYIEDKYGFEAKVKEIVCDKVSPEPVPDLWPGPNGNVKVTMEYEGKEFYVYIAGDKETSEGLDNYQKDEILEDFEELLEDTSGLKAKETHLFYGEFLSAEDAPDGNGMIHTYYDGKNLDEMLQEDNFRLFGAYIDEDLSDMSEVKEELGDGCYLFVSYNSKEDYKKCKDSACYNLFGTPIQEDVDKNQIFIREYYAMEHDEEEYVVHEVFGYDGFYYVIENGSEVYFEEAQIDDADNWNGKGFLDAKQAMEAYRIDTDAEEIMLYIPVDKIDGNDEQARGIALQYSEDGEMHYKRALTFDTGQGEYLVAKIYDAGDYEDLIFTVLVSEK